MQDEPQKEIRAVLLTDDIGQHTLGLDTEDGNYKAIQEVKDFIDLSSQQNHRIALNQLIDRFSSRPYGWPDWEISLLIARLFMSGNISLKDDVDKFLGELKKALMDALKDDKRIRIE